MKSIGGFFETEKNLSGTECYHGEAMAVTSGRVAFRIILESSRPHHVWVPCYACDALLEPLRFLQIPFSFYSVDDCLNLAEEIKLGSNDYLVVVNYFGLKSGEIAAFAERGRGRTIIDNTQAFFEGPTKGCFSFNSARKFFGVPDGGFLYSPHRLSLVLPENTNVSLDHLTLRAAGNMVDAFEAFQKAEASMTCEIKGMSAFSINTLQHIPYTEVRERRRRNFKQYENALRGENTFSAVMSSQAVPFCYPFLPARKINRQSLYQKGIFFPTLWPEVIDRTKVGFPIERKFAQDLLPLPVDHRYGFEEIENVIQTVKELLNTQTL